MIEYQQKFSYETYQRGLPSFTLLGNMALTIVNELTGKKKKKMVNDFLIHLITIMIIYAFLKRYIFYIDGLLNFKP